jgi:hypothetical protein
MLFFTYICTLMLGGKCCLNILASVLFSSECLDFSASIFKYFSERLNFSASVSLF